MSETKRTPWEFVLSGTTPMVKIPGGKLCADFTDSGATIDESIAHAKLAAAAPEMAGALRAAEGYILNAKIDLETGAPKRTTINTIEGGLKIIRAALAKAEGRQP